MPVYSLRTYSNRPRYCLTEFSKHFVRYIILRINEDDFLVWHLNEKTITGRCIIITVISSNNSYKTDVSDLMSTTKSKMFSLIPLTLRDVAIRVDPILHMSEGAVTTHISDLYPLHFDFFWPLKNALTKRSFQSGA